MENVSHTSPRLPRNSNRRTEWPAWSTAMTTWAGSARQVSSISQSLLYKGSGTQASPPPAPVEPSTPNPQIPLPQELTVPGRRQKFQHHHSSSIPWIDSPVLDSLRPRYPALLSPAPSRETQESGPLSPAWYLPCPQARLQRAGSNGRPSAKSGPRTGVAMGWAAGGWRQGPGFSCVPLLPHLGPGVPVTRHLGAERRRKAGASGWGLDPGAGTRERRSGPGHPGVRPAPKGQRLKINSQAAFLGSEVRVGAGQAQRPVFLPGPGVFDLAQVLRPGPSLEPWLSPSAAGSDPTGPARSRDRESLVTHLGGESTSGLCT